MKQDNEFRDETTPERQETARTREAYHIG